MRNLHMCERCIDSAAKEVNKVKFTDPQYSEYDQNRRNWLADALIEIIKGNLAQDIREAAFILLQQEKFENDDSNTSKQV